MVFDALHIEEIREMFERRMFSEGSLVATPWFTLLPLLVLQSQAVHTGWPGGGGGQHGHTPKVRNFYEECFLNENR